MAKCSPGDIVVCLIRDNTIVNIYENSWDFKQTFEIISIHEGKYVIYVPSDIFITNCFVITRFNFKELNADKKFIDSVATHISEHKIAAIHSEIDGLCCAKCYKFYPMAEENQPDGTMICWACRNYPVYL